MHASFYGNGCLDNQDTRFPLAPLYQKLNTMTLDQHKNLLAIVHLAMGTLQALGLLVMSIFFNALFPFIREAIIEDEGEKAIWILDTVESMFFFVLVIIIAVSTLPSIIGGLGLLAKKSWGLIVVLISGCLSIFSFPFGTALGVYGIWVYLEDRKGQGK
jgi:hypothetical protein